MRKLAPMRFCGYEWLYNPKTVTISGSKNIGEYFAPYDTSGIKELGINNRTVKGEGELFGADCYRRFKEINDLYRKGGRGILSLSGIPPFYALFTYLRISAEPVAELIKYEFEFKEDCASLKKNEITPLTHTVLPGETLYSIANDYETDADKLLILNTYIKRPNELEEGWQVKII